MTRAGGSPAGKAAGRRSGLKGRIRGTGREVLRALYVLPRLPGSHLGLCPLPSFVIVGAQKAGTTSLFRYLARNPGVSQPRLKEIHFFDLHWQRGIPWYRAHFPLSFRPRAVFTGEASPYYLFHPRVPERMAGVLPRVKILVLLRNPVDRAISHYHWEVRYGSERLSFRDAMAREAELLPGEEARLREEEGYRSYWHQHGSYLSRGRYAEQLKRWFGHFHRDQILTLSAEELFARPGPAMARVQAFLELPQALGLEYRVHREGRYRGSLDVPREELVAYFKPHNDRLEELLERSFPEWR